MCNQGVRFQEPAIVISEPKERSNFYHSMGNGSLFQCLILAFVSLDPILRHYMAEIHDLNFKELTLLRLMLEPSLLQFS